MKRPKISNDLTVSQGQYGKFIAYADHLEQEIERLKAERVGLVRYCLSIVLDTTVFHEAHLLNNPDKIIEQFNKEK